MNGRNQCDGCQAGIPVINDRHSDYDKGFFGMRCTKKLYINEYTDEISRLKKELKEAKAEIKELQSQIDFADEAIFELQLESWSNKTY